ncbi:MAG: DNA-binding response regulator [Ignavibacteriae bacterium HGW-Ignavibacteriae-3]|nr:MAG: DNA-binding response regulator [Ignavibacteriae bacterium HGW-Ignavibacteriae-3]
MINVFIADDHALIREGIKNLLSTVSDITIVGETADPLEISSLIQNVKCDILILDLSMPGKDGLDVLKEIKNRFPGIKILIMTMLPEDQFARRTLKAGSSGYLTKESAPDELITAIRRIASGRKYVSQNLAEKLAEDLDGTMDKPVQDILSDREFQILKLIAAGKSQTVIADELSISSSTVNTYRSRILEKLNLNSTADLIHFAYQNKLII